MLEFLFVILCLYQLTGAASQLSCLVIPINDPQSLESLILVQRNNISFMLNLLLCDKQTCIQINLQTAEIVCDKLSRKGRKHRKRQNN